MQSVLHPIIGPKEPPQEDLSGRTAIVTGTYCMTLKPNAELPNLTDCPRPALTGGALGIGYEIARNLALQKARVIMLNRSAVFAISYVSNLESICNNRKEEQGDDAISKIKAEGKEQGINVDINWVGVDLGHLKEVQEVFTKLSKEEERCDLVRRHTFIPHNALLMACFIQLICSAGINANQTGTEGRLFHWFIHNASTQASTLTALIGILVSTASVTFTPSISCCL